jgi:asparagine synthase (glutamine-hydrolysing)
LAPRLAFPIENYLEFAKLGKTELLDCSEAERKLLRPFDAPQSFEFMKSIASPDLATWRNQLNNFQAPELGSLLKGDRWGVLHADFVPSIYGDLQQDLYSTDILNQVLQMDQQEVLVNQVLPFVDRLSMAHSVEVRCPFLDYRIVEFVNRLPGHLKIHDADCKYILKKAVAGLLPQELINRPKEGFVQPIYSWMRGTLASWTKEMLFSLPKDLFNHHGLTALHDAFLRGEPAYEAKIWNLVCFSIWCNSRS